MMLVIIQFQSLDQNNDQNESERYLGVLTKIGTCSMNVESCTHDAD